MPPKVKFQREEIVRAALKIAEEKGIDAVTAREVAAGLGVSPRPIFTYYETMDQLRRDVYDSAKERYREYLIAGLEEPIPFLGIWHRYIAFAREQPELYRLPFLSGSSGGSGGAVEALKESQALARESVMRIYNMSALQADCFFRNIWLAAFSFASLIVTGNCPYTDDEIFNIGAEISLATCMAYKEVPGLAEGRYDRDAVFRELVKK